MAKQSIAAQTQSLPAEAPTGFQLPALFSKGTAIEVVPRFTVPYLAFAQPAAKEQWMQLMRKFPSIEDGDPVLFFPEPAAPILVNPLKMTVLAAQQYYATRDKDKGGTDKDRFYKPGPERAERIFASLLVYTPDKAVACTATFKTVKCACAHTIAAEIEKASKPDWAKQGTEFEMAVAAFPVPSLRVVGTVHISSKTGRTSGMGYRVARATVAPSGPSEWKLLKEFMEDDGNAKLQAVEDAYSTRLAELAIK